MQRPLQLKLPRLARAGMLFFHHHKLVLQMTPPITALILQLCTQQPGAWWCYKLSNTRRCANLPRLIESGGQAIG